MTDRIDEIRKRRAAITPGPWWDRVDVTTIFPYVMATAPKHDTGLRWGDDYSPKAESADNQAQADAEFIAQAPDDIDYLLDEITHLSNACEDACILHSDAMRKLAGVKIDVAYWKKVATSLNEDVDMLVKDLVAAREEAERLRVELAARDLVATSEGVGLYEDTAVVPCDDATFKEHADKVMQEHADALEKLKEGGD